MVTEIRHPRMRHIVGDDVSLEQVAGGFEFIEGPVWHPREDFLIFSDIAGDRMLRWSADQGISTFRMPSGMANGNAYDQSGRLITCEHATSRVSQTDLNGAITTLADRYEGSALNSPNDVVVKTDGSIYFTDPTFGRNEYFGVPRDSELSFRGVYRIDPTGELSLLVDDFAQPNGLCFSLDEGLLFVNDTERMHIRVFPLLPNGLLGDGSVWGVTEGDGEGAPDGMKIDSEGNLYCCGQGGIHVFDPEAVCLGVIRTPEVSANFTWGGEDLRSLFICASSGLYRIPVKIPGVPSF
jgi:gluconolactonase